MANVEVYVLTLDTIDELSERTGRSVEQLQTELLEAELKGTTVHYYFGMPEWED